jgi:RHS repeat-associated protein
MEMKSIKAIWLCLVAAVGAMAAATASAGTVTYYHNDLSGSPVAATNAAGQVIWRETYRPYGERTIKPSTDNQVWFTSRRQDADTGLVYMGARYYDPVIGRFVSMDPVGFDDKNIHSHNRYAYANNNPLKYRDPDGRIPALLIPALLTVTPEAVSAAGTVIVGSALMLYNLLSETADAGKAVQQGGGGTANGEQGCIYCVKGDKTSSGKDYVGSTDNLEQRQRDKSDGRNREGAEVVDRYPKGDRDARRAKVQQANNYRGGVDKLDNRRNEVAPAKWPDFGVSPP